LTFISDRFFFPNKRRRQVRPSHLFSSRYNPK